MNPNLTLLQRLQAPTSKFFRPIVTAGVWIAAIAAGLTVARDHLAENGVLIPSVVAKIIEIAGWVAAGLAGLSKLTVDFDELKKKTALDGIQGQRS